MADELDVLLGKVDDPALRAELRAAVDQVRAKRSFGLVFESHLPDHPIRRGVQVVQRDGDGFAGTVERVRRGEATGTRPSIGVGQGSNPGVRRRPNLGPVRIRERPPLPITDGRAAG